MSTKILKSIGDGVLGFEEIKEWNVSFHSLNVVELRAVDSEVKFLLLRSGAFTELDGGPKIAQGLEGNPHIADDAYYPVNTWTETATVNTRAPFIVSDEGVCQMLTSRGVIRQGVDLDTLRAIIE